MNDNEIASLLKLLDDTDEEVFQHVSGKLMSYGFNVIPALEMEWEQSFNAVLQQRIENLIHKIQFNSVKKELEIWYKNGGIDLLHGILIVNKYQYPELDDQKIINQIENIKRDAWLQLNYDMSALEKVKTLNHVFYNVYGFSGNVTNHHDPQNSYLNLVLESKKGNQITLAIIYSIVAQKLDIPIVGVNLPQHFILAYQDEAEYKQYTEKNLECGGILFYINAFNKGFIFRKNDIDSFLKQLNLKPQASFYEACSNVDIIKRVLRNLISSYEKPGYLDKVEELKELAAVLEN